MEMSLENPGFWSNGSSSSRSSSNSSKNSPIVAVSISLHNIDINTKQ